jgi:hypothetical protein
VKLLAEGQFEECLEDVSYRLLVIVMLRHVAESVQADNEMIAEMGRFWISVKR